MGFYKIFLLGPFQVTVADRPRNQFDTEKTRALLAYLAVEHRLPQQRSHIAGLLWPGFSNDSAHSNLRLTLFRLRKTLETQGKGPISQKIPACLVFPNRQSIQIAGPDVVWSDVQAFEDLLEQCRAHAAHAAHGAHAHADSHACPECIDRLARAAALYRGDLLEDFALKGAQEFDEWVLLRREYFHQQAVEILEQLSGYFFRQGGAEALDRALEYAQSLLRIAPWRESAYRTLMQVLAARGQTQEALAQYHACRLMLSREFRIEPATETVALYRQIRERQPVATTSLVQIVPPDAPPPGPPGNLILPLTPLIGRETQLARLTRLLFSYRWVTLVGEGGIGKTRLSLAAAEQVRDRFPDGVWLVPLAEIYLNGTEPTQALANAMSRALGVAPSALVDTLASRKLLLILDSFEHLSPAADLIVDLLVRAPGMHVMVTTRHTLNYQAGYIMRIDGLDVPDSEDDPAGAQFAGVQLFTERAERLSGSFTLNDVTLPQVIRICRMLDGVPLAIELAASWATRRPLEEITVAIREDLDFLTTTMVGTPERHRSMRAVFESSWNLLPELERRALAGCAQFAGDFSTTDLLNARQPLEPVESLADKFLVLRTAPGRYKLHDTLRHFVLEKIPA